MAGAGGPDPVVDVDTAYGPARLHLAAAASPTDVLLLGHGAGGGVDAFDLQLLARRLPPYGITVARFEQPWRTAGRKVAAPPPRLDVGWHAGVAALREHLAAGQQPGHLAPRLWFGGRSAGARVACRTADDHAVSGVVCLSFPLHPPGRPERSRAPELLLPSAPRLVVQGTADTFGSAADVSAALVGVAGVRVVAIPGAGHGLAVARSAAFSAADVAASLVAETAAFVLGLDARGGDLLGE